MDDRKRRLLGALLSIALLLVCSIAIYQTLVLRCLFWTCASEHTFTVFDLSLPSELFPQNAVVNSLHPTSESFGAVEEGSMSIYWQNGQGLAVYNIYRFGTENRASDFFDTLLSYRTSYTENAQFTYRSEFADEFEIGCGISEFGGFRCDMDSRYDEFVISFNATIDDKMSMGQYEKIVIYIDEQIGIRLQ